MQNPLVSIVIPTHNRKKMLVRLIDSIFDNTYKNIEIIVIDDASSDGTFEYVKNTFKKVKIFRNKKNLFTAGSRNEGFRKCKGQFVFFIDDDNELDKYTISMMLKVLMSDSSVGEVGPVNYNFNNKKKVLWFLTKRNMWTTKTNQPRNLNLVKGKDYWETADVPNAFMVRGDIVRKNKIYFRENFGIMYEESDIAYRIRNLGYKIIVSRGAKIYHDIEVSEKGKKKKDYMYHFMEDKRRPFVFARNRIIFHSLYSSKLQLLGIILFWSWFFAAYYIYRILFYNGVGKYSILKRFNLAFAYLSGCLVGIISIF